MGMDRVPRRSKSYLQQLRLSVYTRQASIAIGLEDYAAARSQLAYLRDEVRTLPAGNALFGHFSKAVLDLEHMMAVQPGRAGRPHRLFPHRAGACSQQLPPGAGELLSGLRTASGGKRCSRRRSPV